MIVIVGKTVIQREKEIKTKQTQQNRALLSISQPEVDEL